MPETATTDITSLVIALDDTARKQATPMPTPASSGNKKYTYWRASRRSNAPKNSSDSSDAICIPMM